MAGARLAALMLILAMSAGVVATAFSAEKNALGTFDLGKREYDFKCAVCHGRLGKGDGPYAGLLETKIADLTTLSKRNNEVFPFQWVQEVIDGRQAFKAHGPSDMPIWGLDYLAKYWGSYVDVPYDAETYIRTRVLALTEYVYRLQAK
jgi:mono/diheme cytochrome c family protein